MCIKKLLCNCYQIVTQSLPYKGRRWEEGESGSPEVEKSERRKKKLEYKRASYSRTSDLLTSGLFFQQIPLTLWRDRNNKLFPHFQIVKLTNCQIN